MPLTTSAISVASGADIRPDWHAFGMLVAWIGAGIVTLLYYIWEVGNSLDAFRLAVITSYLLWMACMAILARASILHTNLWSLFGAASLFVALPLMLWGVGTDLQLLRGCPAVEAMIISFVNIFLSVLPMGGIIVQHALFLSVASMELWTRYPPTGIMATATKLMVTATNFAMGICACCLLCLAHNRRITLVSSSAAAAAAAGGTSTEGHAGSQATSETQQNACIQSTVGTQAAANTQAVACTQASAVPERGAKGAGVEGHTSKFTLVGGQVPIACNSSPRLKDPAHPAPSGLTLLLSSFCYNASLLGWVHKAELYLLAAVPQEEAQLLVSLLCAVFVGARFLAYVANFTAPGAVAMSPTMDMLGLLCGMMVGGSKIPDLQDWAHAQHRAYRSVRALLRNIMPAHVADALEAYEAERELASPVAAFGRPPGAMLHRQSLSYNRNTLGPGSVGFTPPWPTLSRLGKGTRSWSGNVKSLPSVHPNAHARSACHSSGNYSLSESSNLLDIEHKLVLDERHSFSERHEQVTILFADIVGFTDLSDQLPPSEVMTLLGGLYKEYDQRAVELGLYTVDTVGDCYMCAANLIQPLPNQVDVMVGFARMVLEVANATLTPLGTPLSIRVGIHTGPLMSGVIGVHRLKFTLLGDTVNVASRMETTAMPNTIQISEHAYKQLQREHLATLPAAVREQGLDVGCPCDPPSMHGQEQGGCSMAMSSSAPCLLESLHEMGGAPLSELNYSMGSSRPDQASNTLNGQEQQQKQRRLEQKQQSREQQRWFHEQPRAQEKGVKNEPVKPESLGERSHSLSQECTASFSTAMLAEQSSHTYKPGGQNHGPGCPKKSVWLERELNIKGKGVMKVYTYTGP